MPRPATARTQHMKPDWQLHFERTLRAERSRRLAYAIDLALQPQTQRTDTVTTPDSSHVASELLQYHREGLHLADMILGALICAAPNGQAQAALSEEYNSAWVEGGREAQLRWCAAMLDARPGIQRLALEPKAMKTLRIWLDTLRYRLALTRVLRRRKP